jgi:hypothetical protein
MRGVIRLTPIVPGEMQPVVWLDGSIKTGFVSGNATEGRGFPQWSKDIFGGDKVHWYRDTSRPDEKQSLCGRSRANVKTLFLPGNYPRCKACEKALAVQKRYGVDKL